MVTLFFFFYSNFVLDLPKENDMTKEEIIVMARQAGFERLGHDEHDYVCYPDDIVAFATLVASAEREACWDIVGIALLGSDRELTKRVATAIRARGNHD